MWQIACTTFVTKTVSKLGKLNFQVLAAFTYELLADILNPISNHLNFKCGQAVGRMVAYVCRSLSPYLCLFFFSRRCTCLTLLQFYASLCIINASSNLLLFSKCISLCGKSISTESKKSKTFERISGVFGPCCCRCVLRYHRHHAHLYIPLSNCLELVKFSSICQIFSSQVWKRSSYVRKTACSNIIFWLELKQR